MCYCLKGRKRFLEELFLIFVSACCRYDAVGCYAVWKRLLLLVLLVPLLLVLVRLRLLLQPVLLLLLLLLLLAATIFQRPFPARRALGLSARRFWRV